MYNAMILLHSYTRWLVVIAMLFATVIACTGLFRQRKWTKWDTYSGLIFTIIITIQFIWGAILYFIPEGIAQAAIRDMSVAMKIRDLRFFSLEHPLQMFIAIFLVHLGQARSRKAEDSRVKFRWAAGTFTIATILIFSAIPWWRPLARAFTPPGNNLSIMEATPENISGDATRGEALFFESVNNQVPCASCHNIDETRLVGPGLSGLALEAEERVAGQSAGEYIYHSIVEPGAFIVDGYADVMPQTFGEQLSSQQVADLVTYILSLP